VSVSLALRRTAVGHPLDATGFVGAGDVNGFLACTFVTSKFAGRAAKGWCLLRAFFRAGRRDRDLPDAAWVERAVRVLAPALRIGAPPAQSRVARWPDALPRFGPAHASGVARLRERLLAHPWLEMAGAAVDGGGVDGAIRSGRAAAARLLQRIPAG
jgi:oxygen-dependent protoporphyrinogen oxidase